MQYLLDTVTIVRHFTGQGKIGLQAGHILNNIEKRDNLLVISVISLMEIMYLSEKNRIFINLNETLEKIEYSSKYAVINLSPDILRVAEKIEFRELHDRLILATAKWLDISVISSDKEFENVHGINVIWA
jgi:PIN domain nuclease of toxin-antitoxin system